MKINTVFLATSLWLYKFNLMRVSAQHYELTEYLHKDNIGSAGKCTALWANYLWVIYLWLYLPWRCPAAYQDVQKEKKIECDIIDWWWDKRYLSSTEHPPQVYFIYLIFIIGILMGNYSNLLLLLHKICLRMVYNMVISTLYIEFLCSAAG